MQYLRKLALALFLIFISVMAYVRGHTFFAAKKTFSFLGFNDVPAKLAAPQSLIGLGEADITPPPLRSTTGFSTSSQEARGFRHRLKARAFYLRPVDGPALMFIQVDLLSGSLLLHHKIAQNLIHKTDLTPAALVLSGTHTHGGPGNFFGSNFYNDWAGGERGLQEPLVDFLASQITDAALRAFRNRAPGTVSVHQISLSHVTRNRSMQAYLHNPQADTTDPFEAVEKTLTLLRFDRWQDETLVFAGAYTSFSVHGTAVPPTDLYHADIFFSPSHTLAKKLQTQLKLPDAPLVAVVNGSHGDNSPNWSQQGFDEAKRLGEKISDHIQEVLIHSKPSLKPLTTRLAQMEVDFFASAQEARLNPKPCFPAVGMALMAGAEDYPTPVLSHLPGFAEGWPQTADQDSNCQGEKRQAGSILQHLFLPTSEFPRFGLIQAIVIQGLPVLTLPFEVTYQAARELRAPLQNLNFLPTTIENKVLQPAVISCSNGYMGYLTTRAEYQMQHYEGGHTLFGAQTSPFLAVKVHELAEHLQTQKYTAHWQDKQLTLRLSSRQGFDRIRKSFSSWQVLDGPTRFKSGYEFTWRHLPPNEMAWHLPLVAVEVQRPGQKWQTLTTDESGFLEIRLVEKDSKSAIYRASYVSPLPKEVTKLRFRVTGAKGQLPLYSNSLSLTKPMSH